MRSASLPCQPDSDVTRRENYGPIFMMDINGKISTKTSKPNLTAYQKDHMSYEVGFIWSVSANQQI